MRTVGNLVPRLFGVAISVLLAALPARAGEGPFTMPTEVVQAVKPLLEAYSPPRRHAAWLYTEEMRNPGNFGRPMFADGSFRFQLQEMHLWLVEVTGTFRNEGNYGTTISYSLCGLTDLLSAGSSSHKPFAGISPLLDGIHISDAFSHRMRVVMLSASTVDVCRPSGGTTFEIKLTRVLERRTMLLPSSSTRAETLRCGVEGIVPSESLGLQIDGMALKIICERRVNDDPPQTVVFAFPESLGIYVKTGTRHTSFHGESKHDFVHHSFVYPSTP